MNSDLSVQLLLMRVLAGVMIVTIQGATIAAMAVLLGDKGPRYDGRLSILPTRHVDLLGLGAIMLTGLGWGQPVAIEAGKLRPGRVGLVLATLAGSAALLLVAVLLLQLAGPALKFLDFTAGVTGAAFVREASRMCVWMALFSLLPIPPLAGAHVLTALGISLPGRVTPYLGWLILLASVYGLPRTVLTPAYNLIAPPVLGVDAALATGR
jgi:Zn-dependent protease